MKNYKAAGTEQLHTSCTRGSKKETKVAEENAVCRLAVRDRMKYEVSRVR